MARQTIPTSGLWSSIAALFNSMNAELYQSERFGVYNYDDLATKTTPISIAAADTWYDVTNDNAGPNAINFPLTGVSDVWDTVSQSFDFSQLSLGDMIDIRIDLVATSTAVNQDFSISLFLADDTGTPIEIPFISEQVYKSVGTHKLLRFNALFIGYAIVRDNQARFKIKSSDPGSVVVNGWFVRVSPRRYESV